MNDNKIEIKVQEDITVLAGPDVGEYFYDQYEDEIYLEDKNIITFSENVDTVVPSFFTGFFKRLVNDKKNPVNVQILKEHFEFEEKVKKAFEDYIATME